MKQAKFFFKTNETELSHSFCDEKRPFVLFLGAGINCSMAPELSWGNMVKYLLKKSVSTLSVSESLSAKDCEGIINKLISNANPYYSASVIKKALGNQYISFIQHYLYTYCNKSKIKTTLEQKPYPASTENNMLLTVADLILSCDHIKAVVTYNYDNFLSDTITLLKTRKSQYRNIEPFDIYSSILSDPLNEHSFPIYHVHGFIPPPDFPMVIVPDDFVLAYDEYFNNIMESYSWQTTTQLHFLNNYCALFIGISLEDWNMLRALAISAKYSTALNRYALLANPYKTKGEEKQAVFLNRLKASVLSNVAGIKAIVSHDHNEQTTLITNLIKNYDNEKNKIRPV